MGQNQTVKVVEDALTLLSEVGMAGGMTAAEMEKATGLTRDKTFRLRRTLKNKEWLVDLGDGKYGLGPKLALLWASYRNRLHREIDKRTKDLINTETNNG